MINDYEKSIIGTFTKGLLDKIKEADTHELYFTITKFDNDIGFSLIHQDFEQENTDLGNPDQQYINLNQTETDGVIASNSGVEDKEQRLRNIRRMELTKHGVIPEFIKISEIY